MNNPESIESFEYDKLMHSLGSNNLVVDVESRNIYLETKAFRMVAISILITLLLLIINYAW